MSNRPVPLGHRFAQTLCGHAFSLVSRFSGPSPRQARHPINVKQG